MSDKTRFIFVHGEKGGAGKSTVAAIVLDRALSLGLNPFLVEGDRGVPDVADRFRGFVEGCSIPLNRPDQSVEAVGELMQIFEERAGDLAGRPVIINLPAGAGPTIDKMAQETAEVIGALGGVIVTLFLVAPGADSCRVACDSLVDGIAGVSQEHIAVPNAFLESPGSMAWAASREQAEWIKRGGIEIVLPPLAARVSSAVRPLKGPLSALANGEGEGETLFLFDRSALRRWLAECQPLADAALGVTAGEGAE